MISRFHWRLRYTEDGTVKSTEVLLPWGSDTAPVPAVALGLASVAVTEGTSRSAVASTPDDSACWWPASGVASGSPTFAESLAFFWSSALISTPADSVIGPPSYVADGRTAEGSCVCADCVPTRPSLPLASVLGDSCTVHNVRIHDWRKLTVNFQVVLSLRTKICCDIIIW